MLCINKDCSTGDDDCKQDCLVKASKQAQKTYMKYELCAQYHCDENPNLTEKECRKEAEDFVCGNQLQFCIGDAG